MKTLWLVLAVSGLLLTILPSILVFTGQIRLEDHYRVMAVGTLFWFVGRSFYNDRKTENG
ncbi:MAG: hypothetical protein KDD15_25855 [Lewinella sp.]|nr:hypothetical protein [Lewinella sp.]